MKAEIEMETMTCAACAVLIVATPMFFNKRRQDHEEFYCLQGHKNYFPQKSKEETLREELAQEKRLTKSLQEQVNNPPPRKRGRPRKLA
jgi:hypothetical protein